MKVIFLDIDGVLNRYVPNTPQFCPKCVEQINRVLATTEAHVVVSSSWRQLMIDQDSGRADMTIEGFSMMLRTHGIYGLKIIGHIGPDLDDYTRGGLIRKWLKTHRFEAVDRYVVIDDCDEGISAESLPFVKTNPNDGLTLDAANDVIRLLNRE